MNWTEIIADKTLRDLPYKIELDRYGNIVMSPASNRYGRLQIWIGSLLERGLGGKAIGGCSVDTPEGVKVADVAWCSAEFLARHGYETPYRSAPEICVEIRSPSDSEEEMRAKVALYLDQGAREAWIVFETGTVRFFGRRASAPLGVSDRAVFRTEFPDRTLAGRAVRQPQPPSPGSSSRSS